MNQMSALNQYRSIEVQSGMMDATPHQMITMLLDGALDRIASAKGAIERKEIARKGELIGRTIAIIDGLRASLDYGLGEDIAANLVSLYDYMERRLVEASSLADTARLDEVSGLLKEIKSGWDAIPAEIRKS